MTHLKQFICQNILVHQELFFHYLRKKVCFFDIAHNSAHEGNNHGMKSNPAAVLPVHSPVAAAERMVIQAFISVQQLEQDSNRMLQQSKQWSTNLTAPHVVPIAESILCQQADRHTKYKVKRVAYAMFTVESIRSDNPLDDEGGVDGSLSPFESFGVEEESSIEDDGR